VVVVTGDTRHEASASAHRHLISIVESSRRSAAGAAAAFPVGELLFSIVSTDSYEKNIFGSFNFPLSRHITCLNFHVEIIVLAGTK